MFVPISDDNPLRNVHRPWVTWAIIAACCGIFLLQTTGMPHQVLASFAIVPAELFKVGVLGGPAFGPNDGIAVAERYTLVSYMFLHGDIMHLVGNMLFLWVFGDNVEDAMGPARFWAFYLICGLAAAGAQILSNPGAAVPMVGASGAIGGVMGGYARLYPHARIQTFIFLGFYASTVAVPAIFMLGYWFFIQLASGIPTLQDAGGGVAFWAHAGGFIAGVLLVRPMVREDLLLDHLRHGRPPSGRW